jgi:hypothetical protein
LGVAPPSTSPGAYTPSGLPVETGRRPSADGGQPPVSFRSCGFSPLQRFSPRFGLRVCCTPLPTLGFAAFPAGSSAPCGGRKLRPFPATLFVPFEGLFLTDSRTVSPRPLPPCRYRPAPAFADTGRPDSEALLHRRVRYDPPPLPVAVARAFPGLRFPSRRFPSTSFRSPLAPSIPHRPKTEREEGGVPVSSPVVRLSRPGRSLDVPGDRKRRST